MGKSDFWLTHFLTLLLFILGLNLALNNETKGLTTLCWTMMLKGENRLGK